MHRRVVAYSILHSSVKVNKNFKDRGVSKVVFKEFHCTKCQSVFQIPITVETDEGEYNACPVCRGLFIEKRYITELGEVIK